VLFVRGAQGLPLCPDKGPTPAGSEGVKAEAQRSPEGCLDAEASAGHCTASRVTLASLTSISWTCEPYYSKPGGVWSAYRGPYA
jgi:hypothetical protein